MACGTAAWYLPPPLTRGASWRVNVTLIDADEVTLLVTDADAGVRQPSATVVRIPTTVEVDGSVTMEFDPVPLTLTEGKWEWDMYVVVNGDRFKALYADNLEVEGGVAEAL